MKTKKKKYKEPILIEIASGRRVSGYCTGNGSYESDGSCNVSGITAANTCATDGVSAVDDCSLSGTTAARNCNDTGGDAET